MNLAGANIGQRWTPEAQRRIRDSRVDGTRLLAETVSRLDPRPALLLASAVGYYGQRGDEELTEESAAGEGFLADVVREWEAAADPARAAGARVVHFRQGHPMPTLVITSVVQVPSHDRWPRVDPRRPGVAAGPPAGPTAGNRPRTAPGPPR